MKSMSMLLAGVLLLAGCAVNKTVTLTTTPPDALLRVNNAERGSGPVIEKFVFGKPEDVFYVTATRKGFQDKTLTVTRDGVFQGQTLNLELKPYVKRISMMIQPVPAIISLDGRPLTAEPVSALSADVEFGVDAKDQWVAHTLTAERTGFIKAVAPVQWEDKTTLYALKLDAMRKDLRIVTDPPGARVYLDDEDLGASPVNLRQRPFEFDTVANAWVDHELKVVRPGYDAVTQRLSWDDGRSDYDVSLVPKQKQVRVITEPPGATVTIDGRALPQDGGGASLTGLVFAPVNDRGDLKTYKLRVTKKTPEAEFYPQDVTVAWDAGRTDYPIKLREILSQPTPATALTMTREKGEWSLKAAAAKTISMKFVTEPEGEQPQKVIDVPKGQTIGSVSVSPDGQFVVYSVVGRTTTGRRARCSACGPTAAAGRPRSATATASTRRRPTRRRGTRSCIRPTAPAAA